MYTAAISRAFILFISIWLLQAAGGHIYAQNIFDEAHTIEYANYLFKKLDYTGAAVEYERALYLNPQNDSAKINLLRTYNRLGDYPKVIYLRRTLFPDSAAANKVISAMYIKALYKSGRYSTLSDYIKYNKYFMTSQKEWIYVNMDFLNNRFDSAYIIYKMYYNSDSINFSMYNGVVSAYKHYKVKKPVGAAIMSAIIPGSGKVYTGEWKDGLINFISVATWGYLTYRGFSIRGYKSGLGYTSALLGTGFYIGNVYGAALSAKRVNYSKQEEWKDEVRQLFENHN